MDICDSPCHKWNLRRRQWHPTPVLLPGKFHGRRSLVGHSPWGREESDTTKWLHFHFSLSCIGGGNGTPLQCSCLENPRDEGAWWAAVYGVAQSRRRLKWLSSSSWNLWTLFQIDVFKVENKIDDVTKESSLHLNIIHELLKYNVFIYVLLYSFNK